MRRLPQEDVSLFIHNLYSDRVTPFSHTCRVISTNKKQKMKILNKLLTIITLAALLTGWAGSRSDDANKTYEADIVVYTTVSK